MRNKNKRVNETDENYNVCRITVEQCFVAFVVRIGPECEAKTCTRPRSFTIVWVVGGFLVRIRRSQARHA